MRLVRPSIKYKKEYLNALEEAKDDTGETRLMAIGKDQAFEAFVKLLSENAKGINLAVGHVPSSTFWLIDKNEFIGRVSIRHKLNKKLLQHGGHVGYYIRKSKRKMGYGKKILKLGLGEARKLGIRKVMVTCDDDNLASIKIIEENKGILENIIEEGEDKNKLRRYWIDN